MLVVLQLIYTKTGYDVIMYNLLSSDYKNIVEELNRVSKNGVKFRYSATNNTKQQVEETVNCAIFATLNVLALFTGMPLFNANNFAKGDGKSVKIVNVEELLRFFPRDFVFDPNIMYELLREHYIFFRQKKLGPNYALHLTVASLARNTMFCAITRPCGEHR